MGKLDPLIRLCRLNRFSPKKAFSILALLVAVSLVFAACLPSLPALLVSLAVVLIMVYLGRGLTVHFPHSPGVFGEVVIPLALGMGLFQLVWFVSVALGLPPLAMALVLAAASQWYYVRKKTAADLAEPSLPWLHLGLAALFCAAIVFFPFKNFGQFFAGAFHFRASFWAVTMKHFAVVNNLVAGFPFTSYYFHGEPFHYYYLSYAFPALLKSLGVSTRDAVFLFHGLQGLVFILLCFYLFFQISKKNSTAWLCNSILIFSMSYEGIYFILKNFSKFLKDPLFFRALVHFDGVSNLFVAGPQIDAIHRAILFTPMHLQALSFFVLLVIALHAKRTALAGPLCLFSFFSSFFLGAVAFLFAGVYAVFLIAAGRDWKKYLAVVAACGVFSLLFVRWSAQMRTVKYAVSLQNLSWDVVPVLLLNFGPFMLIGGAGLLLAIKKREKPLFAALFIFLFLLLLLCFYVHVSPLGDEVPIKLALVIQVVVMIGIAATAPGRKLVSLLLLLLCLGLPSALGNIFCAQDNHKRSFTLSVPLDEMRLCRWIAGNLPPRAVVQAGPQQREWFFSLVPVFAERPTFVGDRMHVETFLIAKEAYRARLGALNSALTRVNDPQGRQWILDSPIDYLFYGLREKKAFPEPQGLKIAARFGGAKLFEVPRTVPE